MLEFGREMTASKVIEEIKRLDPNEQLDVIRFAYQLDATPSEIDTYEKIAG